ncbi:MAG: DUF1501 domain-containing protein [Lewinellaceae bacterium]|nr:DUF1501 domain-containing protein [Lewinellaceae bacterium]MCB9289141.1 DUF1501 domain-containing protein [Lewinellaceae bacterium]
MKRRDFLKASALASTSLLAPSFLPAAFSGRVEGSRFGKILVVIQLSGGNDGLNTIIPYRNEEYYRSRPTLAIPAAEVLPANDELGFNPALEPLRALYDEGLLSIINSVGYPNPDRSHFRSMDIWHTASDSDEYLSTGWLGRYLDSECDGCATPYHALELDDSLSLALKGREHSGFAMSDARQLKRTTDNRFLQAVGQAGHHHEHEQAAYLYKIMVDTQSSADYLYEHSKTHSSKATYPLTPFGQDLKKVAELITADAATRIYYVNLTGFDTHANQRNRQARLLQQLAEGVQAFVSDLKQNGLLDDTLIMAFSEFGRRVKQNASNGTDHGTANNVFLLGGQLKQPGFFNPPPDLLDLDEGDLKYQVDFRSLYATILEMWLEVRPAAVLGGEFEKLAVV